MVWYRLPIFNLILHKSIAKIYSMYTNTKYCRHSSNYPTMTFYQLIGNVYQFMFDKNCFLSKIFFLVKKLFNVYVSHSRGQRKTRSKKKKKEAAKYRRVIFLNESMIWWYEDEKKLNPGLDWLFGWWNAWVSVNGGRSTKDWIKILMVLSIHDD